MVGLTSRGHIPCPPVSAHGISTPVDEPIRVVDAFDRDFYCVDANDTLTRKMAYRVRYDVYCVEQRFEDPSDHPNGLEMDDCDDHAPHKLLVHRPSGLIAGVVRLILPMPRTDDRGLPFFRLVGANGGDFSSLPARRTAEVSRFAIVRQFREKFRGIVDGYGETDRFARQALLSNVSIGLMRAVVELAADHGVTHLCAVMEPALLRLLARLGIHFDAVGSKVDHHGWRQPCSADLDGLLARSWEERPDVWEVLTDTGSVWPLDRFSGRDVPRQIAVPA